MCYSTKVCRRMKRAAGSSTRADPSTVYAIIAVAVLYEASCNIIPACGLANVHCCCSLLQHLHSPNSSIQQLHSRTENFAVHCPVGQCSINFDVRQSHGLASASAISASLDLFYNDHLRSLPLAPFGSRAGSHRSPLHLVVAVPCTFCFAEPSASTRIGPSQPLRQPCIVLSRSSFSSAMSQRWRSWVQPSLKHIKSIVVRYDPLDPTARGTRYHTAHTATHSPQ